MPRARELPRRIERVDEIHRVRVLGVFDPREMLLEVRARDLVGGPAAFDLALVLVKADILIAEFQDVGLGHGKLEGNRPNGLRGVLDLGDEVGPGAAPGRPVDQGDEVLHLPAAGDVLLDVDAAVELRRELAGVETRDDRRNPRHAYNLALSQESTSISSGVPSWASMQPASSFFCS